MTSSKSFFALAVLTATLFGVVSAPAANARTVTKVKFEPVTEISEPTVVTAAPGSPGLLYAVSRLGKIRVIKRGKLLPKPLLNIENQIQTGWVEQGLLGLAFPPDFKKTGRYYIQYNAKNGDNKIDEYQVDPKDPTTTLDGTRRNVLRIPAVSTRGNHNGGPLEFLGENLYISVGDGNDPGDRLNLAQNLNSLRGKILRINPKPDETTGRTYRIPASNPFVNKPGRDEVFAYGFRNPHSFAFYKPEGGETHMVITDVGQSRTEELNYLPFKLAWGANFGWHDFEGTLPFNCGPKDCPGSLVTGPIVPKADLKWPQLVYSHASGCSIIGGPVVTDPALTTIEGRIIYGDFCKNRTRTALPATGWITDDKFLGSYMPPGKDQQPSLSGFGEDRAGHIYPFSYIGEIYKLVQTKVEIKPTRAEIVKWCAKKENKKKPVCVKLNRKKMNLRQEEERFEEGLQKNSVKPNNPGNEEAEQENLDPRGSEMEALSVVEEPVENSIPVQNPSTGETIADVPVTPPDEVSAIVTRVRENQVAWEELGFRGRRVWLNKLRDWMFDNADAIGDTMQAETGKVRAEAMNEGIYLTEMVNFYGSKAEKYVGEQKVRPYSPMTATHKMRVQYRPHPVVGLISPWNFPLILSIGDAIPALMAGCAVVLKPSEFTPLGVQQIVNAWKEDLGAPDVLDCVVGTADTANALIDDSDFIGFTGSDRVGRLVMAACGRTLTPVSLELGGKDPMIVLEDSNIDRAVNGAAWGGMFNSGQFCMSMERIYVEEPAYDEFVTKLTDTVNELKQGADGTDFGGDVGAMTSPSQIDHVESQVDDAIKSGARALTGGKRVDGTGDYYEPTVLVDVDHSMGVMRDETFGPVVGVMKVKDTEEAVVSPTTHVTDCREWCSVLRARRRRSPAGSSVARSTSMTSSSTTSPPACRWAAGRNPASVIGMPNTASGSTVGRSRSSVRECQAKSEPLWFPYTTSRRELAGKLTRFLSARGKRRFGKRP